MAFHKRRHFKKPRGHRTERPHSEPGNRDFAHPENTGSEAAYFRSLVDSHAKVKVVLKDGECLRGHIRYYDQDCFSVGLSAKGPKIFLRKASVSYISEE